jgi:DNA-directed RNA polymerase subunit alpha
MTDNTMISMEMTTAPMPLLAPSFAVTQVSGNDVDAVIAVEPLEQGYGHTLGNALRRILLSSLPGFAVTRVRVQGVDHQFSTLDGMKEDVVEFVLNLKALRVQSAAQSASNLYLDVKGPKTVTAADFSGESGITVINRDLVLANLTDGAKLKAEVTIEPGVGYTLATDRKGLTLGEIPVDALFSPVINVSYKVESTRVGRRTDFDRILFSIRTDGSVSAMDVLKLAGKILAAQAMQVVNPTTAPAAQTSAPVSAGENEVLRLTVEELDLPTRIANALRKGGFKTVGELVGVPKGTVSKVKNLGGKSVDLINDALKKKGVSLME